MSGSQIGKSIVRNRGYKQEEEEDEEKKRRKKRVDKLKEIFPFLGKCQVASGLKVTLTICDMRLFV